MVLEGQVHGFVARVNSKLGTIAEAGPVQFFLDINQHVGFCVTFCLVSSVRFLVFIFCVVDVVIGGGGDGGVCVCVCLCLCCVLFLDLVLLRCMCIRNTSCLLIWS